MTGLSFLGELDDETFWEFCVNIEKEQYIICGFKNPCGDTQVIDCMSALMLIIKDHV